MPLDRKAILDFDKGLTMVGSREFYMELLQDYLTSAADLIVAAEAAINAKDDDDLLLRAHGLKGISASLAMEVMRKIAEELEQCARNSQRDRYSELLMELRKNFSLVTMEINTLL
ncbi:MAG: Hpt domain-containing protein [Candidatus Cloacimonetes bacterium]|nr:Hpt domain-containing protein [Candidatus Cloacimonadota bacterium]